MHSFLMYSFRKRHEFYNRGQLMKTEGIFCKRFYVKGFENWMQISEYFFSKNNEFHFVCICRRVFENVKIKGKMRI